MKRIRKFIVGAGCVSIFLVGATLLVEAQQRSGSTAIAQPPSLSAPATLDRTESGEQLYAVPATQSSQPTFSAYGNTKSVGLQKPGPRVVAEVGDGLKLSGELIETKELQFEAVFGSVKLPLGRIAGMKIQPPTTPVPDYNSGSTPYDVQQTGYTRRVAGARATVVFQNGDSIQGHVLTDTIRLRTTWGDATIKTKNLVSLRAAKDARTWQKQQGRWQLIEPRDAAAGSATAEPKVTNESDYPSGGIDYQLELPGPTEGPSVN